MDGYELSVKKTDDGAEIRFNGQRCDLVKCIAYLIDSVAQHLDMSMLEMLAAVMILLDSMNSECTENQVQQIDVGTIEKSLRKMRGEEECNDGNV